MNNRTSRVMGHTAKCIAKAWQHDHQIIMQPMRAFFLIERLCMWAASRNVFRGFVDPPKKYNKVVHLGITFSVIDLGQNRWPQRVSQVICDGKTFNRSTNGSVVAKLGSLEDRSMKITAPKIWFRRVFITSVQVIKFRRVFYNRYPGHKILFEITFWVRNFSSTDLLNDLTLRLMNRFSIG